MAYEEIFTCFEDLELQHGEISSRAFSCLTLNEGVKGNFYFLLWERVVIWQVKKTEYIQPYCPQEGMGMLGGVGGTTVQQ